VIKFYNLQNKLIGSFFNYPANFTQGIVIHPNGFKEWWLDNKLHRLDGPAIEWANGHKEWYKNGELHRLDGPAFEANDTKEWYVDGKEVTELECKLLHDIMKLKALI